MVACTRKHLLALIVLTLITFRPGSLHAGVKLYTVSSDNQLRTVDLMNGATMSSVAISMAGETVLGGSGLATHPQTGQLYALLDLESGRRLATVDPETGVATSIGPLIYVFADITFGADGTLYGVTDDGSDLPETLFTLNTATAEATLLKALGNGNQGEAIAFNPADGLIYHASGFYAVFEKLDPTAPQDPPIGIFDSLEDWEPTALLHWRGEWFLWASREYIALVQSNGSLRSLSYTGVAVTGMAFGGTPLPCPQPLYAAAYVGPYGPAVLYGIDKASGEAEAIGPIGFERVSAMDFGNNAVLYAVGRRMDASHIQVLLTIDPCTGQGTEVGPTPTGPIHDISFRSSDGALFAYEQGVLHRLDATTGAATLVGLAAGGDGDANALSFNLAGDVLYHAYSLDGANTVLQTLDPVTAEAVFVTTLTGSGHIPNSMDADPNTGMLYSTPGLSTVDPNTGALELVGELQSGLDGLAFYSGVPVSDFTITVLKSGSGTGTVSGGPIDCGATCSALLPKNTMLELIAVADSNSNFTGWTGACTGMGACTITMGADRTVTAQFSRKYTLTLTVAGSGSGMVLDAFDDVFCYPPNDGPVCLATVSENSQFTFHTQPDFGSVFAGWGGDCTGTGQCELTMSQDRNVTATFNLIPTFDLHVALAGTGSGSVTGPNVDCGGDCSETYEDGTQVTLAATAAQGSVFMGWNGDCSGTGQCVLTMSQARNVTATFDLIPTFDLHVARAGTGSGSVSGPNIDCGSDCSETYQDGTQVTLTATAAQGSVFVGWSGACTGTGQCVLTMNQDRSVTATFDLPPDFSFGPPPAPQTVAAGQAARFTVTLNAIGGFGSTVSFACTAGVPPQANCSFAPQTVDVGAGQTSTVLTISTQPRTVSRLWPGKMAPLYATWLPLAAVILTASGRATRRRRLACLGLVLLLSLQFAACGSSSGTTNNPAPPGTPAGSYTITVTATGGNLSHTQTVSLTVN